MTTYVNHPSRPVTQWNARPVSRPMGGDVTRWPVIRVRCGYKPQYARRCAWCGDYSHTPEGHDWHHGTSLPQHKVTHGCCKDCQMEIRNGRY